MSGIGKHWAVSLADSMRLLRALKGLGLRAFAKELSISPATLSRIERGYGCDLDKLVSIHKKTGIAYNVLLGETRP